MFEPKKILFSPQVVEKKAKSLSSMRSRNQLFISQQKSTSFRKDFLSKPGLRKNLPQTSNLLLNQHKSPKRFPQTSSIFQDSGISPRSDCEVESLTLKNNLKVLVSSKLTVLLMQILKEYKNCQVITDSYSADSGVYRYLFNSELKPISSMADLTGEPMYVIISYRIKIPETAKGLSYNLGVKPEDNEKGIFNRINMYESIIPNTRNDKKCHKSPLYVLKANASQSKIMKTSANLESSDMLDIYSVAKQIFPFASGKKVKEGAGGFKKAVLLYEKMRYSISPIPISSASTDLSRKQSIMHSKRLLKELGNIEETCIKYSLTRQEFINILSDFTYLKDKNLKPTVEALKKAYSINGEVLKGINPQFYSKKEIEWDDFVKFFVIVVLQRGTFTDLFEFVVNFITQVDELKTTEKWARMIGPNNQILIEKVEKLIQTANIFEPEQAFKQSSIKKTQEDGISIYDLRIFASLIIKST